MGQAYIYKIYIMVLYIYLYIMVLLPGLPANTKMESIVGNFEIPERGGDNIFEIFF